VKSVTDSKWQKEGSRRAFYSLLPETGEPIHRKQSALSPESEEPIMGMIGSFTAVVVRPRPKNNRLFRPQETGESRSALYRIGKKKPHARKGWTRILADHSRARRVRAPFARSPSPSPSPSPARRASARVCSSFFLSPTLARARRASNYLS
jgi:hypothetical protein